MSLERFFNFCRALESGGSSEIGSYKRDNAHWVSLGALHILISYETPIAFQHYQTTMYFVYGSHVSGKHLSGARLPDGRGYVRHVKAHMCIDQDEFNYHLLGALQTEVTTLFNGDQLKMEIQRAEKDHANNEARRAQQRKDAEEYRAQRKNANITERQKAREVKKLRVMAFGKVRETHGDVYDLVLRLMNDRKDADEIWAEVIKIKPTMPFDQVKTLMGTIASLS